MYAYNCNPRLTLFGIYPLFLLCNPSLELSTWQEVINVSLDIPCIQQTSSSKVGCKIRHMCNKFLTKISGQCDGSVIPVHVY